MNDIANYLKSQDICLDLHVPDKPALFDAVGMHIERQHDLPRDWVVQSLSRREQAGSTGVGEGLAIPHARVNGLTRTLAVYVRLSSPIPFDAPDDKPVSDVLVLLVPSPANLVHLKLLSEVTQMFSDRRFRKQLRSSADAHEIVQLFTSWRPS
jgi:nitrogen PTS system EIIA component